MLCPQYSQLTRIAKRRNTNNLVANSNNALQRRMRKTAVWLTRTMLSRGNYSRNIELLDTEPSCCVDVLEDLLLGSDKVQRLSSRLVAQTAATYGVLHNHKNATATTQDQRKGTTRECTPHSTNNRESVTLQESFYNRRSIRQEKYCPLSYTKTRSSGTL